MPDNVTHFPGPKPAPLRSVRLEDLLSDAPLETSRETWEERKIALRYIIKLATDMLHDMEEQERGG